jgi:phosphosulfolactate synthase
VAGLPLDLPARPPKPRDRGLTFVIDRGMSVGDVDALMEVAGDAVDLVKLGWGTALVTGNLEAKLARLHEHGVLTCVGGTITELAIRDGRVDELAAWLRRLEIGVVEVSDGTIEISREDKCALILGIAVE